VALLVPLLAAVVPAIGNAVFDLLLDAAYGFVHLAGI
jgi:hypothetical protein